MRVRRCSPRSGSGAEGEHTTEVMLSQCALLLPSSSSSSLFSTPFPSLSPHTHRVDFESAHTLSSCLAHSSKTLTRGTGIYSLLLFLLSFILASPIQSLSLCGAHRLDRAHSLVSARCRRCVCIVVKPYFE